MDTPPSFSALIWVFWVESHDEDRGQSCIGIRTCNTCADDSCDTSSSSGSAGTVPVPQSREQRSSFLRMHNILSMSSSYRAPTFSSSPPQQQFHHSILAHSFTKLLYSVTHLSLIPNLQSLLLGCITLLLDFFFSCITQMRSWDSIMLSRSLIFFFPSFECAKNLFTIHLISSFIRINFFFPFCFHFISNVSDFSFIESLFFLSPLI